MSKPLTMTDAVHLEIVLSAAQGNKYVARLIDDKVVHGTARSIGDERGNFLTNQEDIRDGYLRVSGTFEFFWPVAELMDEAGEGTFVTDYQP